jgi:hypothetical protein
MGPNSAKAKPAPHAAPTNWATINAGTWYMAIPANVVVNPRANVTAGLANEVEAVP